METLKNRITGMFLGIAIGDALGMPVESWSAEEIAQQHGRVNKYLSPKGHKHFSGRKAGTWTDDTQLTLAVADGLIEAKKADIGAQVAKHIAALKDTDSGWGRSTRESVRRLANGVSPEKSGEALMGGLGNGVAMKIAPVGALLRVQQNDDLVETLDFIKILCCATHPNTLALSSAYAQALGICYCLGNSFDKFHFINTVMSGSLKGTAADVPRASNDLTERLRLLYEMDNLNPIADFGGGSCLCYDSVPFSYFFFLKNPNDVKSLYNVVSAGGDTDTNGSIVGALLGALNGPSIFAKTLLKSLDQYDRILDTAQRFCDCFGIKD